MPVLFRFTFILYFLHLGTFHFRDGRTWLILRCFPHRRRSWRRKPMNLIPFSKALSLKKVTVVLLAWKKNVLQPIICPKIWAKTENKARLFRLGQGRKAWAGVTSPGGGASLPALHNEWVTGESGTQRAPPGYRFHLRATESIAESAGNIVISKESFVLFHAFLWWNPLKCHNAGGEGLGHACHWYHF